MILWELLSRTAWTHSLAESGWGTWY